jgi:hypothetical protein
MNCYHDLPDYQGEPDDDGNGGNGGFWLLVVIAMVLVLAGLAWLALS